MNDKTKIIGALALGAIAGIALVKLLESEKGQEFIASAKEKANATANDIKARIAELETELAQLVNNEEPLDHKA
jgi:uncharacterized protein YceH (UPF0502 family)